MISDLKEMFGTVKPIIGVVHLLPLPGSPKHMNAMEEILERAVRDAKAYEEGGVDGIIIENFGDIPFYPEKVGPETVASMTHIASRIKKLVKIPIGIQVLRNDAIAALAIAKTIGGKFIRVNVLTEAMVTDQGVIQGKAYEIMRFRKAFKAEDIKIFADVQVKHASALSNRDIVYSAEDLALRGLADAVIVTGEVTGVQGYYMDVERLKGVRALSDVPIFAGGGVHKENVEEFLNFADGVIIGTSLKVDAVTTNPVDPERVSIFMKKVNEIRR